MYITIDKQRACDALDKKIAECKISERIISEAIKGIETVAHHKNITSRVVSAIKESGVYASLHQEYTQRLVLYFGQEERIYRQIKDHAEYHDDTNETIYFNGGYPELLSATKARLQGVIAEREKYQSERDGIDSIIAEAETLRLAYEQIESRSYIIRNVFGIK